MDRPRKVLLSWSSGKDSAWALHLLRADPTVRVGGLLTTVNAAADRVAMHAVRTALLEAQAAAAGLPLHVVHIPHPCANADYEGVMAKALAAAAAQGFEAVAFGDLFLEDVRRYREERMAGTGLSTRFPLWGLDTGALAREMVAAGVRARVTCVDPRQIDPAFAGRAYDAAFLADLPAGADPCGENGEFHTFVHAGPMFSRALDVRRGEVVERDGFVFADLLPRAPAAATA